MPFLTVERMVRIMAKATVEAYRAALISRGNWRACNGRRGAVAAAFCDGCAVSADCLHLAKYHRLDGFVDKTRDEVRALSNG